MGDYGWWYSTWVGDAKSPVVAKRPYIIGTWTKLCAKAAPPPQVLIGCVNRFRSNVQLRDAILAPDIS
jgi:hypothetical protein